MIHVYLRVSSKAQDTELQKPALEREVEGREAVWYRDKFTGRTMQRPGWQKLYNSLKKGDTVLIWRLDRLGRTCHELARLFQEFQERGINLVSVKDKIDLSTATGRLLAHMLASIAQFDNEVRTERVRIGQQNAKAAGKSWGGKNKGHRSSRIAEIEKDVRTLHKSGQSISQIARTVDCSRPTVYSILGLTPAAK
jgi:DNA invertase Pin-like site-specific DNA recombinase